MIDFHFHTEVSNMNRLIAISKAATGRICSLEDMRDILKGETNHLSNKGLSGLLKRKGYQPLDDFSFDVDNHVIWFMPMRVIERPLSTVGLGDCFSAGYSLLAY